MTCKSDGHRLESKAGDILRPAKTKVTPPKVDLTTLTKAVPIPAPLQERNLPPKTTGFSEQQCFFSANVQNKINHRGFLFSWLVGGLCMGFMPIPC